MINYLKYENVEKALKFYSRNYQPNITTDFIKHARFYPYASYNKLKMCQFWAITTYITYIQLESIYKRCCKAQSKCITE